MKKMSKGEWEHINCRLRWIERKLDSVIEFFGIDQMSFYDTKTEKGELDGSDDPKGIKSSLPQLKRNGAGLFNTGMTDEEAEDCIVDVNLPKYPVLSKDEAEAITEHWRKQMKRYVLEVGWKRDEGTGKVLPYAKYAESEKGAWVMWTNAVGRISDLEGRNEMLRDKVNEQHKEIKQLKSKNK